MFRTLWTLFYTPLSTDLVFRWSVGTKLTPLPTSMNSAWQWLAITTACRQMGLMLLVWYQYLAPDWRLILSEQSGLDMTGQCVRSYGKPASRWLLCEPFCNKYLQPSSRRCPSLDADGSGRAIYAGIFQRHSLMRSGCERLVCCVPIVPSGQHQPRYGLLCTRLIVSDCLECRSSWICQILWYPDLAGKRRLWRQGMISDMTIRFMNLYHLRRYARNAAAGFSSGRRRWKTGAINTEPPGFWPIRSLPVNQPRPKVDGINHWDLTTEPHIILKKANSIRCWSVQPQKEWSRFEYCCS